MATKGELRVFIVAGEVSGDTNPSRLMSSLKKLSPLSLRFSGAGGCIMCKEGLKSLFPMEDIAVTDIWELLPYLNKFRVRLRVTVEAAILLQPHVVVTVDSKGFSFGFLKKLRASFDVWVYGFGSSSRILLVSCQRVEMPFAAIHIEKWLTTPVRFHYVAPSFWAWKGGEARLSGLVVFVNHIFYILPHEESVCKSHGLQQHLWVIPFWKMFLNCRTLNSEGKIQGNSEEDYK